MFEFLSPIKFENSKALLNDLLSWSILCRIFPIITLIQWVCQSSRAREAVIPPKKTVRKRMRQLRRRRRIRHRAIPTLTLSPPLQQPDVCLAPWCKGKLFPSMITRLLGKCLRCNQDIFSKENLSHLKNQPSHCRILVFSLTPSESPTQWGNPHSSMCSFLVGLDGGR